MIAQGVIGDDGTLEFSELYLGEMYVFECLQIQTDSPQLLIRRSGEREGRKRARSSGSGGPNPQLQGRRMVSFSAKIA